MLTETRIEEEASVTTSLRSPRLRGGGWPAETPVFKEQVRGPNRLRVTDIVGKTEFVVFHVPDDWQLCLRGKHQGIATFEPEVGKQSVFGTETMYMSTTVFQEISTPDFTLGSVKTSPGA